jgi:hypothetical protein
MVEVFKTDIKCELMAEKVKISLLQIWPHLKINFDLEDCDSILRVESELIPINEIITHLRKIGILCEILD